MPASKKNKSRQINLVPEEGLASTTSGRILLWILSTFRLILILTELVVIGAFISRFWLDAKNTDLSEEMKEAKNVISDLSSFEEDFKLVQKKLEVFDSYKINKGWVNSNLKTVVTYKPPGVYFENVTVGLDGVSLTGISVSEIELQQYLVNLRASKKFDDIKIGSLSLSENNSTLKFSLNVKIKKEI